MTPTFLVACFPDGVPFAARDGGSFTCMLGDSVNDKLLGWCLSAQQSEVVPVAGAIVVLCELDVGWWVPAVAG